MTHRTHWPTAPGVAVAARARRARGARRAGAPRGRRSCSRHLSAKPTPHVNGKPDFNGTWDHLGGIEFVRPQKLADGSMCVRGCAPAAGARAPRAGARGRATPAPPAPSDRRSRNTSLSSRRR